MTSSSGTGALQTWVNSQPQGGLAAADAICRAHAAAGGLPEAAAYRAWLSDSGNDMYCRVRGIDGNVSNLCNLQSHLHEGAGPWLRLDGQPFLDVSDLSLRGTGLTHAPRAIVFDEMGDAMPAPSFAFTATYSNGRRPSAGALPCQDWTSAERGEYVNAGAAHGAGEDFSYSVRLGNCDVSHHLICLHAGTGGTPLPAPPPVRSPRRAFVTHQTGTGDLSTWTGAQGHAGADAGDAVCRSTAAAAGLADPHTYRAWLSTDAQLAAERFEYDGAWYRRDGALVARNLADLQDGFLENPILFDESGEVTSHVVFTGTAAGGALPSGSATCNDWSAGSGNTAIPGIASYGDRFWTQYDLPGPATSCANDAALYCLSDHPYLFGGGFEAHD